MREKPILFSGPMVRAILDGRKTQTRRIVKNVTLPYHNGFIMESTDKKRKRNDAMFSDNENAVIASEYQYARPLCEVGDRLWVRETFRCVGTYKMNSTLTADVEYISNKKEETVWIDEQSFYKEDARLDKYPDGNIPWHPSIHMPRWASRITLDVTGVRVERLQDITVEDIIAEGLSTTLREHDACIHLKEQWIYLWDSINADRAPWESNPWVWVIEFKTI